MKEDIPTLIHQAWQADSQGDVAQARTHYLAAARQLASDHAWPELTTVLGNLGMLGEAGREGSAAHLTQAFWLCLFVRVPIASVIGLARALLDRLGAAHEAAPLIAATTLLLVNERGGEHPDREALQTNALMLLARCAEVRGLAEDRVAGWFSGQRLNDPAQVIPATQRALIGIVGGEEWLFDPRAFADRQ